MNFINWMAGVHIDWFSQFSVKCKLDEHELLPPPGNRRK